MSSNRFVRVAAAGVLLAGLTAGTAVAQPFDKRTYFTFSGPVAIPGVTLPAGKYLFRIVDTSSRDVIQVLSADGRQPYAMFFGRRAERPDFAPDPEVRFMETAAGMPAAIQTWWYPGERSGYEFVYPKEQARLLARGTGQPVLTTVAETTTPPETGAAELARISPRGEDLRVETPAPPAGPAQRGEIAPPSIPIPEPSLQARADLPKTASALPLVGIGALMLLLGAGIIRGWRVALN